MPAQNTPPASPGFLGNNDGDGLGMDDDMDEGELLEVIDLDEELGEDDDEDVEDEDAEESMALAREDNSCQDFDKHGNESVFCVRVHPRHAHVVASGGQDDTAYVWDARDGRVLFKGDGFKDSVTHVDFSQDGTFLAAADMSGVVKVWRVGGGRASPASALAEGAAAAADDGFQFKKVWEFETGDVTSLFWHHGANVLFATTADSELWMWKIPSGDSKIFMGHGEKAECAKLLSDGRRAVVGYSDGTMRLFELRSGDVLHNVSGQAGHSASVVALAVRDDNNLVASGGVDGAAKIFQTKSGKSVGTFVFTSSSGSSSVGGSSDNPDERVDSKSSIEALAFTKSEQNFLITGSLEGIVTIWDVSTQIARKSLWVGSGVAKMVWRHGSTNQLLVSTLDGLVRLLDVTQGKVVADCSGSSSPINDFDQSSDGKLVAAASDDGHCKVYDLDKILSADSTST